MEVLHSVSITKDECYKASEELLHDYKTYYKQNYQSNKSRRAALAKDIAVLQRKIQVEV